MARAPWLDGRVTAVGARGWGASRGAAWSHNETGSEAAVSHRSDHAAPPPRVASCQALPPRLSLNAVDTKDPAAVEVAVCAEYLSIFPQGDPKLVSRIFACVTKCFRGECHGYQAIDARYHDLEHTLQGTVCMMRLLATRHRAGAQPVLDQRMFELGLLAILLHDTGYAKQRDDVDGTGAKYTFTHVARSAEFAAHLLREKGGFEETDITAVQNMIRCTGVNVNLLTIPFQSGLERLVGFALGTADLLGQMAAPDYVDKLPILYEEFEEAISYNEGRTPTGAGFQSADELIRRTPDFWAKYVLPKIEEDFGGLYHFLEDPYPGGPNEYLKRIEENMARIRERCG